MKRYKSSRVSRRASQGRNYYCNPSEDELATILRGMDIELSKRGYPDFTIYNSDGSIYGFIEVKPKEDRFLKTEQRAFSEFCYKFSIPFLKWFPCTPSETVQEFLKDRT